MTVALALLSSVVWGSSDFVAGLLSRRTPPLLVLACSLVVASLVSSVAVVVSGLPLPAGSWLGWGLAAGVSGTGGLLALYAGLASGQMGVVAPVAALGVVVPVAVGLGRGDPASLVLSLGIGCAVVGAVLASGPQTAGEGDAPASAGPLASRRPVLLAALAALGLGISLVCVQSGSQSSVLHTLWVLKVVGAVLVLGAAVGTRRRRPSLPARGSWPGIVVVGVADLAANVLYGIATRTGPLSIAGVLASLYPVTTIALAALVLRERLRAVQVTGVVLALLGIVLIAS